MTRLLASRRRVFFIALALLLLLDLGRSVYARIAYSKPFAEWDGQPYDVKLATWPPSSNVSANAPLGQSLYIQNCAVCHGTAGNGMGVAAPSIHPRPRDFTQGVFKYKTTGPGQPPTTADLINAVTNGLPASPMPYFKDLLTADEIAAVVEYVKGFSPVFQNGEPEPLVIPNRIAPDGDSLARGAETFKANCVSCHGNDGRARASMKDANGFTVQSRDLTAPWTFRGGSAPEQLFTRVTDGLAPSPMPSFALTLTVEQRWDMVNYVTSLARTAPWEAGGTLDDLRTASSLAQRGEYIVNSSICGLCHTPVSTVAGGIYWSDQRYLAGGMQVQAYPHGTFISRNLTSDPRTGVGNKSVEELANIIRTGQAADRAVSFWGMPWAFLHALTPEDATAVATYLKTIPPVKNETPALMEYGFLETVVMKLTRPMPTAAPTVLTYAVGTYANPNPGALPLDWPRRALVWAQWIVLGAGVILFLLAGQKGKRAPRGLKGWALTAGGIVGALALTGFAALVYNLPTILPPDIVAQNIAATQYQPDLAQFNTPEEKALVQRGAYVFATTSCMFCHGGNGAGGAKISGLGMGTAWVRNISQDTATGIGAWSDEEIMRAIRTGVSRTGRQLHWQAMPWDHFSNLDEEDVRALTVYLRTLPPVTNAIPDYAPPAPGDCVLYTFWLQPGNNKPGCQ